MQIGRLASSGTPFVLVTSSMAKSVMMVSLRVVLPRLGRLELFGRSEAIIQRPESQLSEIVSYFVQVSSKNFTDSFPQSRGGKEPTPLLRRFSLF